jgi:hypothetical protein
LYLVTKVDVVVKTSNKRTRIQTQSLRSVIKLARA